MSNVAGRTTVGSFVAGHDDCKCQEDFIVRYVRALTGCRAENPVVRQLIWVSQSQTAAWRMVPLFSGPGLLQPDVVKWLQGRCVG
jgi:hypothetical protein